MASKSPNLKVNVSADTSKFQKGMRDSKDALRDFSNTGKDALGKFGDAVGVNFDKVSQMSNSVRGLGVSMSQSGNAGVAAFGKIVEAAGGAATAIATIGLSAAVASFKLLREEAENFKTTVEGANLEHQATAYVDTYRQAMHDFNSEMGKSVAQFENDWKMAFTRVWSNAKAGAVQFMQLFSKNGGGIKGFVNALYDASDNTKAAAAQADKSATKAMLLQNKLNNLIQLQKSDQLKVMQYDTEIAALKEKAKDSEVSASEKRAALLKAEELINKKYELQHGIQEKIAMVMHEMTELTNSTQEQIDAAYQASIKSYQLERDMHNEMAGLSKLQKSVTAEAQKEAEARATAAAAAKAIADDRAALSGMGLQQIDTKQAAGMMDGGLVTSDQAQGVTSLKVEDIQEVNREIIDLSGSISTTLADAITATSEIIGSLCADLATGQDAWGNFKNAALSAFGDMAINVGKLALATGIAILGIRQGLMSLNPYAAIAAGAALIALGVAVKVGMANIANGSGSSGTASVASATGSSNASTNAYETQEIEVKVTGTLQASGSQLLAVINNENNRTNHTT